MFVLYVVYVCFLCRMRNRDGLVAGVRGKKRNIEDFRFVKYILVKLNGWSYFFNVIVSYVMI